MANPKDNSGASSAGAGDDRVAALEQRFDRLEKLVTAVLENRTSAPASIQVIQPDRAALSRAAQKKLDERIATRDRDSAQLEVALASGGRRQFVVAIIQQKDRGRIEVISPPMVISGDDPETAEVRYRKHMGINGVAPPSQYYLVPRAEARPELRERADKRLADAQQQLESAVQTLARLSA